LLVASANDHGVAELRVGDCSHRILLSQNSSVPVTACQASVWWLGAACQKAVAVVKPCDNQAVDYRRCRGPGECASAALDAT